jgi:hypothetical protein
MHSSASSAAFATKSHEPLNDELTQPTERKGGIAGKMKVLATTPPARMNHTQLTGIKQRRTVIQYELIPKLKCGVGNFHSQPACW